MNNLFKGAAIFIGGALVGAAAALLLTSENVEKVREQIKDLAQDAKKKAQECCEQIKQEVEKATAEPKPEEKTQTEEA